VIRCLANGLCGGARWRSAEHRTPLLCTCGHRGEVRWCSPHRGSCPHPGVAWCRACLGPWAAGDMWALLPDDLLPPDLCADAMELRRTRGLSPRAHPELCHWQASSHGSCPLCGLGEGGAEHLWMWCPAVALAWRRLHPAGRPLIPTLRAPLTDAGRLASFLHQASFLHASLWGHLHLPPAEGAARLIRMTSRALARHFARTTDSPGLDDDTDSSSAASDSDGEFPEGHPTVPPPAGRPLLRGMRDCTTRGAATHGTACAVAPRLRGPWSVLRHCLPAMAVAARAALLCAYGPSPLPGSRLTQAS
jgi:hypothetical protein